MKTTNYPVSLKENIHKILYGSNLEKEKFKGQFFYIADTPKFMKKLGLSGDYFSVKYGVISRHFGKDREHNLSEDNWNELCNKITKPFAISKYGKGYRLFISIQSNNSFIAVGVDVKNIGKSLEVNSVKTVFTYNQRQNGKEDVIFRAKEITPDQAALLDGLNSLSLPPDQGQKC